MNKRDSQPTLQRSKQTQIHHMTSCQSFQVENVSMDCSLYSAGTESGPSSCRTAISKTSEVGVSGCSCDRSSEHLLMVGEITSGLVSQDSVLCSDVAVLIVVATLGGTGSNSSSSSSRMGDSWISARQTRIRKTHKYSSGSDLIYGNKLTAEGLWILLSNLPF